MLVSYITLRNSLESKLTKENDEFIVNLSLIKTIGSFVLYEDICCFTNSDAQLEATIMSLKNIDSLIENEGIVRVMELWYSKCLEYLNELFSKKGLSFDKEIFRLSDHEVNSYRLAIRKKDYLTILRIGIRRHFRALQSIKEFNSYELSTIKYRTLSLLEKAIYS